MKKFGKFLFGTLSLATLAAGVYYLYKNIINKDSSEDDFEEFEDEFEESDDEDEEPKEAVKKDTREYVSINITSDAAKQDSKVTQQAVDKSPLEEIAPEDNEAED
jgi:hypothetical protein